MFIYIVAKKGRNNSARPLQGVAANSGPMVVSGGSGGGIGDGGGGGGGYNGTGASGIDLINAQSASQKDLSTFGLGIRGATMSQDLNQLVAINGASLALRQGYIAQDQNNLSATNAINNTQKLADYNFLFAPTATTPTTLGRTPSTFTSSAKLTAAPTKKNCRTVWSGSGASMSARQVCN